MYMRPAHVDTEAGIKGVGRAAQCSDVGACSAMMCLNSGMKLLRSSAKLGLLRQEDCFREV